MSMINMNPILTKEEQAYEQIMGFRDMFGQERGSDLEFEVGMEGQQTWRLTAHRRIISATSPVMRALCYGPLAHKQNRLRVNDVDPRAFQCLLRHLYGLQIHLQTIPTALATLYAAHKYLCPGLEWECAVFLNEQIQYRPDYVLEVLHVVSFFCQRKDLDQWQPTAPPAEELENDIEGCQLMSDFRRDSSNVKTDPLPPPVWANDNTPDPEMGEASMRLRHNCLQVVDQNADFVLALEQMEDLDLDTLIAVTSRDTLAVSNEMLVLAAAERWAECQCKRDKKPRTSQHLRQALGGPHVVCGGQLARLLLLTPQQFAEGPAKSALLTSDEQRALLVHLNLGGGNRSPDISPEHVAWLPLATPRKPCAPNFLPIPPSKSSQEYDYPPSIPASFKSKSRQWGLRWPRSKRKNNVSSKFTSSQTYWKDKHSERPGCCSRTCEIFLSVIACLFD